MISAKYVTCQYTVTQDPKWEEFDASYSPRGDYLDAVRSLKQAEADDIQPLPGIKELVLYRSTSRYAETFYCIYCYDIERDTSSEEIYEVTHNTTLWANNHDQVDIHCGRCRLLIAKFHLVNWCAQCAYEDKGWGIDQGLLKSLMEKQLEKESEEDWVETEETIGLETLFQESTDKCTQSNGGHDTKYCPQELTTTKEQIKPGKISHYLRRCYRPGCPLDMVSNKLVKKIERGQIDVGEDFKEAGVLFCLKGAPYINGVTIYQSEGEKLLCTSCTYKSDLIKYHNEYTYIDHPHMWSDDPELPFTCSNCDEILLEQHDPNKCADCIRESLTFKDFKEIFAQKSAKAAKRA